MYMLEVLGHFRDLDAADRRSCLYRVFCVVMGQKPPSQHQSELCSIGTNLLTEILANWEKGTVLSCESKDPFFCCITELYLTVYPNSLEKDDTPTFWHRR